MKDTSIITALAFLIAGFLGGYYFGYNPDLEKPIDDELIFCTQEAKECPDGSYVGRVGPNCEFGACPGE